MHVDLLERKATHFVLWRPNKTRTNPKLIIGTFQPGAPPTLAGERQIELKPSTEFADLYEVAAANCGLADGKIYHYWFEVDDSDPTKNPPTRIRCTDPTATTVNWDLLAPRLPSPPYTEDDRHAASVIKFDKGRLVACDPGGEVGHVPDDPSPATLPPNNRLVIYELPTTWKRSQVSGGVERGVGTFRDVLALVLQEAPGANFADLPVLSVGRSYLTELGVNALELLPPADSFFKRTWGYDTANFFAPDFDLGKPEGFSWSTANSDLAALVGACHQHKIRFFIDVVMAFARHYSYEPIDSPEFFILDTGADPNDTDDYSSRGGGQRRDGFGSTLFRYAKFVNAYDPVSGKADRVVPARQVMKAYVTRWMRDFAVDGIRMDSIENIANWDFVQEYKDHARALWNERWKALGLGPGSDERFLVVGEELSVPLALLTQGRLDGLWNEKFKGLIRAALVGRNADDEPSFEWTVRKAIDCRNLGFTDGAQAVLYLTSHDVEGFRNERLYNYLVNNGVWDTERRIKLAFCCLLTAVGVPQILAGDEFADQHDRFDQSGHVTETGGKEVDPVNYSRLSDDWRHRIFVHVSRLVKLRTTSDSLSVNDTEFIHVDFDGGKRVLAWRRGGPGHDPVVVVANFSDFTTDNPTDPRSEYVIHNWPATPPGRKWQEITQDRIVPPEYVGREPIYSWEAKVYTLA